MNIPLEMIG